MCAIIFVIFAFMFISHIFGKSFTQSFVNDSKNVVVKKKKKKEII